MGIVSLLSGIANAIAGYFGLKSSANRQRREAEGDVAAKEAELESKKAAIKGAVYSANDAKLNEIVLGLLQPSALLAVAVSAALLGCAPQPRTVYLPTDRVIESCTNSRGLPCKAVPDAVMAEMLEKLQELQDMKREMKVDKRVAR